MKKNMGTTDKLIRIVFAIIFTTLYFTNVISGTLGIVLMVAAAIFLLTSLFSFCPIYPIFGLKTCSVDKK